MHILIRIRKIKEEKQRRQHGAKYETTKSNCYQSTSTLNRYRGCHYIFIIEFQLISLKRANIFKCIYRHVVI